MWYMYLHKKNLFALMQIKNLKKEAAWGFLELPPYFFGLSRNV